MLLSWVVIRGREAPKDVRLNSKEGVELTWGELP